MAKLQGIRSQPAGSLRHLGCDCGKACPFCRGEEVHFQPLGFQAYLGQQSLGVVYPTLSAQITLQVMTRAFQSASYKDGVSSLLKGPQ